MTRVVLAAFALALAARLALIALVPYNYSFDGYQRWAGRDWLLVQGWLPLPQVLVWATAKLGGGVLAARVVFALVGALASAAGVVLARRLGGPAAGGFALALGLFGPLLAWSVVPYQEGLFLLLLLGGLALALAARERGRGFALADLVLGALALVRYEGWPLLALYVLWRREPRAALALWGVVLWLGLKAAGLTEGHRSGLVDFFEDWEGLGRRFALGPWLRDLAVLGRHALDTGTLPLLALGLPGLLLGLRRRTPGVGLLGFALLGQVGVTALWIVGLESAMVRMLVVPGMALGVLAAIALGWLWERAGRPAQLALVAGSLLFAAWGFHSGLNNAIESTRGLRPDLELGRQMEDCEGCVFAVTPRGGLGRRDRHDGCEVVQGSTRLLAGRDFTCTTWGEPALAGTTHLARWDGRRYEIRAME